MPDADARTTARTLPDVPPPAEPAGDADLDAGGLTAPGRLAADEIARKHDRLVPSAAAAGGRPDSEDGPPAADEGGDDGPEASHDGPCAGGDEAALTARHREAARHFGLSEDDVEALGERAPAVLERLARIRSDIGRRYSQIGRAEQKARARGRDDGAPPAADAGPGSLAEPFDVEAHGPAAPALNRLVGTVNALARGLRSVRDGVDELRQRQQGEARRRQDAAADAFFAELRRDYPEFDLGPAEPAGDASPAARARRELLEKAAEIREGRRLACGEEMDFEQSLREALAVVRPEAIRSAERRRISESLRHRGRSLISRPAQRRADRPYDSDEDRAAQEIASRARQLGVPLAW